MPTPPPADPLAMARNCVRAVAAYAKVQADPDPDIQLRARINRVGERGEQAAQVAGQMALVSIEPILSALSPTR